MAIFNSIVSWFMRRRMHQIEFFLKYPDEVQKEWLQKLLQSGSNTEWGKKYDYSSINNFSDYVNRVPVSKYEDLQPYIDRLRAGENNVLWNTDVKWFAKSSGTTGSKSKFIPVTSEALNDCHYKGGKDLIAIYLHNNPDSIILEGKTLAMGGSLKQGGVDNQITCGDVSAILMDNLPFWAQLARTPSIDIALLEDWEEKLDQMSRATIKENVTALMGVPSWMLVLLNRVLEITGKKYINEVWNNLEVFVHGGVSFSSYKNHYDKILSKPLYYLQTYNASEGFFGIQDRLVATDMLLMLDYGIFYEFIPLSDLQSDNPKSYPIWEVETGKNYAIIISTNAGLWRYMIGDTVEFTSLDPYRIRVTGRTKSFVNTFGEEVIEDNANKALEIACRNTNSDFTNYTVAPLIDEDNNTAMHEWIIEFVQAPDSIDAFTRELDVALKSLNSDYEAKRHKDIMLKPPKVHAVPKGTFYEWMKNRERLGGQNKVPRLSNERNYVDEILQMLDEK
ncbi:MAG: GH3 auxin-responsive promoter family protein [Bacteroidales bacterium]